ncbi:MAG: hypothetical protein R3F34_01885 [Planctomycetota bacterium]
MAAAQQRAALQQLAARLERAGGGAPSRGPGAAPLTYGREAPDRADAFAPKRLTPAGLRDLEHSQVVGVGSTAPEVDAQGEGATSNEFGREGTQSGERRRLAPKHRRAVERFFSPNGG